MFSTVFGKQGTLKVCKKESKKRFCIRDVLKSKWFRTLIGISCCVGFCLLFGVLIFFTKSLIDGRFGEEEHVLTLKSFNGTTSRSKFMSIEKANQEVVSFSERDNPCKAIGCDASCSGYLEGLSYALDELYFNDLRHCNYIRLVIKDATFPNNTIHKNWLDSSVLKIFHVQIRRTELLAIEAGAFTSKIFSKTIEFYIEFCKIDTLKTEAFKGLHSLTELSLWQSNITNIEDQALSGISDNLVYLNLRKCDVNLTRLFEVVYFPNLVILILSETVIPKLNKTLFKNLTSLAHISLYSCSIVEIENGSFTNLTRLEKLDLRNNNLITLPDNLLNNTAIRTLKIRGNKWKCSCDMNWLKQLKLMHHDFNSTMCYDAQDRTMGIFSNVKFCIEDSRISRPYPESSTTPTESNTDPIIDFDNNDLKIDCYSAIDKSLRYEDRIFLEEQRSKAINIDVNHRINVKESDDNRILVTASPKFEANDSVIWFKSKFNYSDIRDGSININCLTHICSDVLDISEPLESEEMYTFCVLREGKKSVYPLDCKPILTKPSWGKRPWITKKDKPVVILTVITSTVLCYLIGVVSVFFVIRKNPVLLRGSKRVVTIENNDTKVIVLPPESKNNRVCERCNSKDHIEVKKVNLQRSVSEISIGSVKSSAVSYVSALEPTPAQLLHWRLERLRGGLGNEGALTEINDLGSSSPTSLISQPNLYIDINNKSTHTKV